MAHMTFKVAGEVVADVEAATMEEASEKLEAALLAKYTPEQYDEMEIVSMVVELKFPMPEVADATQP